MDVERVKDLAECMSEALAAFPKDFSVAELLSAEATLFTSTARVAIDKSPLCRDGIIAVVQHMLLVLMDGSDTKQVH